MTTTDPTTQSNYTTVKTYHVDLVWTLDWENKRIIGSATHHLRASEDNVKEVMLVARVIVFNPRA
jgi:leukotriene-A4 hydrolase